MRISHKYKFVFISKPRCASTTIRKILDPFSDIQSTASTPYHHHSTALELKVHFDSMGWKWQDYFVFTTVRNPWNMMVSYYSYFRPDINGIYNFEQLRDSRTYQPDNPISFRNWILTGKTYHRLLFRDGIYLKNVWVDGFSKLTLANTVNDINGDSLVNRIVKVEEMETEIPLILTELCISSSLQLDRSNDSEHSAYQAYYDSVTKKIIEEQFISDIEFGKYRF